ncbi:MAG: YbaB/EbfC family nucleoid-associated protein [Bacilli bacterium]|jgi:DNA-binding YbaB/EbfC family protein
MKNMQQMMAQAQKMQRELAKAQAELAETEFEITKSGAVTIVMRGDRMITSVKIDPDLLEPENQSMVENLILLAVNELLEAIHAEEQEINEKITGRAGGLF